MGTKERLMLLNQLFEAITRTGKGNTAVVGWGRGMGHKGHMMLASSVITKAKEMGGDPYFVVSKTVGKDDPITPDEKLAIYKKVFPQSGHIFQPATDEMPDLTRVLTNLNKQGYVNAVVVVGADQVKAFQYLKNYNGKADKSGNVAFNFDTLDVISRQETGDPSAGDEGPRATPMRQVLQDPTKSDKEQFIAWRDAMSPEIGDDEVRDLMMKAKTRMAGFAKPKKEGVAEVSQQTLQSYRKKAAKQKSDALDVADRPDTDDATWVKNMNVASKRKDGIVAANKRLGVAEGDRPGMKDGRPYSDPLRRHPGNDSYMTPEYLIQKYQDELKKIAAGPYKRPKDVAMYQARIAKLQRQQGVAEDGSNAMADTAKRLSNKDDGKVAKLRAAGDKRREEELKSRNIAKKDKSSKDQWGNFKEEVVRREEFEEARMSAAAKLGKAWDQQQAKSAASRERAKELLNPSKKDEKEKEVKATEEKQRLDPKCWKGYRKQGTKMKGGVRVNNCVKIGEGWENIMTETVNKLFRGK
jgi:hypothetical protein